ncbi:endonuclease/exonuclease/phosphatase family protein [Streptomyces halobius]|uniref:Endonuclease/exonuclease/phosphatase family protein n=1 Tax=Streptomyces halobius TaxID=2879846 RepID=A0ABY4M2M7_9ACTN|nr:endonuclease/exonuclease/phosphatase family protein [Streptomyces halobius]UQA92030.1 endonuclease/exonuclease/phosphatase family protein [Streptomyces halobius]
MRGAATVLAAGLAWTAVPAPAAARPTAAPESMRVLSWNIFHGGKDAELGGAENLPRVIDQLVDIAPDVFFSIETYGSAEDIRTALSARAGKGRYTAVRVTSGSSDNLWVFTRYTVVTTFPKPTGNAVSDFNIGGARVQLPSGRKVNLFDTWLSYTNPWIGDMIDTNAHDLQAGRTPRYTRQQVAAAEAGAQLPQIRDVVHRQVPAMLGGNTDPVLLAGDFNTVPAVDWNGRWAHCADHFGMSYELRTTEVLADAGFRDTYREANPDVCAAPGRTWSPQPEHASLITPDRIDFIFAKGAPVQVRGSYTVDERLPQHEPGRFYSDHAAVVTDLVVS